MGVRVDPLCLLCWFLFSPLSFESSFRGVQVPFLWNCVLQVQAYVCELLILHPFDPLLPPGASSACPPGGRLRSSSSLPSLGSSSVLSFFLSSCGSARVSLPRTLLDSQSVPRGWLRCLSAAASCFPSLAQSLFSADPTYDEASTLILQLEHRNAPSFQAKEIFF